LKTAHRICLRAFRDIAKRGRAIAGPVAEASLHDVAVADDDSRDWERWAFCWAAGLIEREVERVTWQAFWLTAVEGAPAADAAQRLGIRIGSVYTARCRVLARIRELVHELSRSDL
jgi:RNA polymerase sigma-70 factor (ECF subfamily)